MGYWYLVTHPSMNPAEQDLTLLSGRDTVLSLWYYDSTLDNFFCSQKVTKKEKKSLISPAKTKNEKNRNENQNPIILALLIGQEAVLSLQLSRTRITNKLHECFQRCYISSCILKSLASKFSLLTDDPFLIFNCYYRRYDFQLLLYGLLLQSI